MPTRLAKNDACEASTHEEARPMMVETSLGNVETITWGEGPAVLSLHGAMGGYDQGMLLASTIASPHYQFIAVSRPGYLGTSLKAGRSPQDQADVCAEVLIRFGIANATVIAISGGGPTALQFALRHPEMCAGLVMVSACSDRLNVPIPFQWQLMKLTALVPAFTAAMRKRIMRDPKKAARRSIPDEALRLRTLQDQETAALFQALQMSIFDRMASRIAGTDNDILQARAEMNWPREQITAPTLIVHGTNDRAVPCEQAKALAARIPEAELLTIEGGEHVSIFTHRDEIRSRVDRFLRSIAEKHQNGESELDPGKVAMSALV
jgi:pimeloyl-ACP methyl ester carboxylesterase